MRSGNHKYIDLVENKQWPKFFEEKIKTPYLFDLAKDPKERHNLLAENAAEGKNLRDGLAAERQQWQAIRRLMNVQDGDAVEIDAESVKQLRAIGYNR